MPLIRDTVATIRVWVQVWTAVLLKITFIHTLHYTIANTYKDSARVARSIRSTCIATWIVNVYVPAIRAVSLDACVSSREGAQEGDCYSSKDGEASDSDH